MQKGPATPKGFRDIEPATAARRREIINTIAATVESFGFVPIETPTLEFAQTMLGKYGEEEKLIYQFKDRGGRDLALRYDLTVPLARFIANNPNLLTPTFSRYQVGQVFRGEKPQRGRYREFTQFDIDTVGSIELAEDAKIILAALTSARKIGLSKSFMAVSDRVYFADLPVDVIRAWDKFHKVGIDGIKNELSDKKYKDSEIDGFLDRLQNASQPDSYSQLAKLLTKDGLVEGTDFSFDKTLARGLDYYTGTIMELKLSPDEPLSVGGGGRYDNLIGMFAGRQIPAVGFSFGIDRLIELTS